MNKEIKNNNKSGKPITQSQRAMFWAIIFFITAFLISMAKGKMYHKCGERIQQTFC